MGRMIDALIGRIETARRLDRPGYALGKAISRTAQIVGRPGKKLGNTLHGLPLGHPVHPLAVAIPVGTWSLAFALDVLGAAGVLRDRGTPRAAELALKAGRPGRCWPSPPGWPTGSTSTGATGAPGWCTGRSTWCPRG